MSDELHLSGYKAKEMAALLNNLAAAFEAGQIVIIPRAQYEALMAAMWALDQCVDDFGETGQCVCQNTKEQAIEALAALRAAGIDTEGKQ